MFKGANSGSYVAWTNRRLRIFRNHHHDRSVIEMHEVEDFLDRRFPPAHLSDGSLLARWVRCTGHSLSARHSTPVTPLLAPQLHHDTTKQTRTRAQIHRVSIGRPPGSAALKRRAKRRLPRYSKLSEPGAETYG
jgi:hypothetical protein